MAARTIIRYLAALLALSACSQFSLAEPALASRLERIQKSQKLRVCIWPDYYSISFRNPRTQELSGIDIDMARALAKDLGIASAPQFVDSSFAHLAEDLAGDRCDIAMFAIGITTERTRKMRFSQPYLRSDIYAITTKSNRRIREWTDIDQPGVVVAVHKGTYHEQVMRQKLKRATLLVADSPFAREQEVESGRADVFMTDYPYSQRMLASAQWARLVIPPSAYHLTSYAYAVAPGDDAWLATVERFVGAVKKDGRLLEAARRHKLEKIVLPD